MDAISQLESEYRRTWDAANPVPFPRGHNYDRGFVAPHGVNAGGFADLGEALAAIAPLHSLRLLHTARAVDRVAATPVLQYVRNLCLESNALCNHHLPALLNSPHLVNVRILNLNHNKIGIAGCQALAATTSLPALRVLSLCGNPIKDRGFLALVGASWFTNPIGLHVANCGVSDGALVDLTNLTRASQLRSLDVGDRERSETAARAILESPFMSRLGRLWFPERNLSAGVRCLACRFGAKFNERQYRFD